jgi:hypothetical protein
MDEYDKIRLEINTQLNEVQTLLYKRDELKLKKNSGDIFEKHKLQSKIDEKMDSVNKNLRFLKTSIDALKKKKKPLGNKFEIYTALMTRYDLCRVKCFYI